MKEIVTGKKKILASREKIPRKITNHPPGCRRVHEMRKKENGFL